ncbi:gamma-glutamyltransferase [Planococcus lenghuensis]|uniref:gamma-glutamyltransferase n=1 Tax=Planococcus lenghuensis TaxID=2213202 RepID=UPI0022B5F441|nr:gamma-glutamyltransferase [Planococcus lenghuensis]
MKLDEIFRNQKADERAAWRETAIGSYGMAASAVKEATEVGERVLADGGNAVDAIIAIQFALAAVERMDTGIGASGFITIYDSERNETKVINGHSQAPAAVNPELFLDEEGNVVPFLKRSTKAAAVGIPGIMKAMELAHERYGTMPLERLINPAIELADGEYEVKFLWDQAIKFNHFRLGEEAKKVFMPDGVPLVEGDTVTQQDLANTLRIIREEGFCVRL